MNTIELKKLLMLKITEINDISFLKALKTIIESKTETEVISLTEEQKNQIIDSRKEIEQGMFVENKVLEKEFQTWLNAR
ncbi:MAG TPA: hypothetical protein DHV29_03145 [Bacteroidales bacterium]|nr:MAG: hypothetical protein A2W94_14670 [Bacteroidetes bacterium GWE2_42_42]HCB61484.1 hypothetical protein [Bacteroidales bacterium]HCY22466.1 hypothetical protein [Bacteroidales bacterium]